MHTTHPICFHIHLICIKHTLPYAGVVIVRGNKGKRLEAVGGKVNREEMKLEVILSY